MKTRTVFISVFTFLCLSTLTFAQAAIFSVSSVPVTTVISTGNAELVGDITLTQIAGTTVAGAIIVSSGGNVNITSALSAITINCTGGYVGNCPTVDMIASIYSPGLLVIDVYPGVTSGTFTVTGVRVQINGSGLINLVANVSATGNLIAAGSTSVTVINSTTGSGIAPGSVASYNTTVPIDFSTSNPGNPIINGVNGAIAGGSTTVIKVGEGFLGAWSKNVGVRITVSAAPPVGVSFTFPAAATSYEGSTTNAVNGWVRGTSASTTGQPSALVITSTSTSSTSRQIYYYESTGTGFANLETLEIPVTIAIDTARATFPLAAAAFTYTVSLAPVQGPYNMSGANAGTPLGLLAPRFAALNMGPAMLVEIATKIVTDLVARAKPGKADLTWTWEAGAHHYNVYRGTVNGGPYLKIGIVTAPGLANTGVYADFGLTNGTTYYYVVREADAGDRELSQSNQASARPIVR